MAVLASFALETLGYAALVVAMDLVELAGRPRDESIEIVVFDALLIGNEKLDPRPL